MPPPRHPRGFALLIVLWSVVLLAVLATGMTAAGRSDVQLATNVRRAAAAEAAADGGVAAAIFHVMDAPARAWLADDTPHALPFGPFRLTVRVANESRRVNPNYAAPELMAALLTTLGADRAQAQAIAQAIVAWHAPDAHDATVAQYRNAGMQAAPTGAPFRSVDELGLVMGMTPDLLARLRPHLSVYAEGPLDYAGADAVIRAAVQSLGSTEPAAITSRPAVISVTSDAQGRDGSRFIRHAVVALGRDKAGRLFRVVQWDALPAP